MKHDDLTELQMVESFARFASKHSRDPNMRASSTYVTTMIEYLDQAGVDWRQELLALMHEHGVDFVDSDVILTIRNKVAARITNDLFEEVKTLISALSYHHFLILQGLKGNVNDNPVY